MNKISGVLFSMYDLKCQDTRMDASWSAALMNTWRAWEGYRGVSTER